MIRETNYRYKEGTSERFSGWEVFAIVPSDLEPVSVGSREEWESLLQAKCLTTVDNDPLVDWSPGSLTPTGLGRMASDNRSVPLTSINTEKDQVATVKGSIKFNKPVRR